MHSAVLPPNAYMFRDRLRGHGPYCPTDLGLIDRGTAWPARIIDAQTFKGAAGSL